MNRKLAAVLVLFLLFGNGMTEPVLDVGSETVSAATAVQYQAKNNVNLRSGPSTAYRIVTTIPKDKVVAYLGQSGAWYKVKYGTRTGWAHSAYLAKVYPAPAATAPGKYVSGYLIVNKRYRLPSSYNPGVIPTAQKGVDAMIAAARKQGVHLTMFSGFRSYARQKTIYNNYVKQSGQAVADRFSARPGHSEHQSGLAFDFGGANKSYWLKQSFAHTKEGKWLAANAHTFGFILRYPKGKERVTGYMYEPWHFRYVGSVGAAKIKASGKTLEEYLGVKGS